VVEVSKLLSEATERVRVNYAPSIDFHYSQARTIIRRYTAAIEPNFLPLMAIGMVKVKSPIAKAVLKENFELEVAENHRGLLYSFARYCGATPTQEDYKHVEPWIESLRDIIRGDGLSILTALAVLENTSLAFIPHLRTYAEYIGTFTSSHPDYTYLDKHGMADIKHAQDLVKALEQEILLYNDSTRSLVPTVVDIIADGLLGRIFTEQDLPFIDS
jgi:hypothetical protein